MSTNYPTTLDSYSTKNNGDVIDASHIDNPQDAIVAIETKVGADSSAVTSTIDYKLKNTSSIDPGHKHTLSSLSDFNVSGPSSGQALVYNGTKWANSGGFRFGGVGTDGALTITSGTTTIDCASAELIVKNYTSIAITGSGKLAFINPHANGTVIILKSMGNVTLTSSSAPMIDCTGMGAAGGATASASGNPGISNLGSTGTAAPGQGVTPTTNVALASTLNTTYFYKSLFIFGPGGGGSAGPTGSGPSNAAFAAGGRGGGALIVECGGALNFTTTNGISTAGTVGANGSVGNSAGTPSVGGGGGGAGTCHIFTNTITANSGTINIAGGAAGNGGGDSSVGSNWNNTASPGGGASVNNTSSGGAVSSLVGQHSGNNNGQVGGVGFSLVVTNTDFA